MGRIAAVVLAILTAISAGVGLEAAVTAPVGPAPPELRSAIARTMGVSSIEVTTSGSQHATLVYNAPDRLWQHSARGVDLFSIGAVAYQPVVDSARGRTPTYLRVPGSPTFAHQVVFGPLLAARDGLVSGSGAHFTIEPGPASGPLQILGGTIELRRGYVSVVTLRTALSFTVSGTSERDVESITLRYGHIDSAPAVAGPDPKDVISCRGVLATLDPGEPVCKR